MDNRRQDLLNQLEAAAAKQPFETEDFLPISFQILYGLPTELQLRAARHICERYVPIYEKKLPGSDWCQKLLGDLDAWFRAEREATPEIPDEADSADTALHYAFTSLLVGYHHKDDPTSLTAGVCGAISDVIRARAQNVFLADDPVVIRFQKERRAWWDKWGDIEEEHWPPQPDAMRQLAQPEHNPCKNVAFIAVYRREWLHVVEWLRAEAVWKYPEPDELGAMLRGLKRWEDHECCPIGPESADEST